MIRFLQKENRLTKALFVVIIGAAVVSMVIYLIPGLSGQSGSSTDTFAVVYPHWYSRFLASGEVISQQKVAQLATQRVQQQYPQYAGNPMIMNMIEPQVANGFADDHQHTIFHLANCRNIRGLSAGVITPTTQILAIE